MEYEGDASLSSGIGIGSSREDVVAVYGVEYILDGDYLIYEYENISLSFEIEDEKVVFIEIY